MKKSIREISDEELAEVDLLLKWKHEDEKEWHDKRMKEKELDAFLEELENQGYTIEEVICSVL